MVRLDWEGEEDREWGRTESGEREGENGEWGARGRGRGEMRKSENSGPLLLLLLLLMLLRLPLLLLLFFIFEGVVFSTTYYLPLTCIRLSGARSE